jgi:Zn-dependent oligopeptidase
VPSHLFEHFARDPIFIQSWARHPSEGVPPPLEMVQEALKERDAFPALDVQKQVHTIEFKNAIYIYVYLF